MTQNKHRYLSASLVTVVGTVAVFSLVITINQLSRAPEQQQTKDKTSFHVEREKKKPPKITKQEKPEPEQKELKPPPPLANLDSSIGSVDIPVPGFDVSQLGKLDGSLGADKNLVMTDETVDRRPEPVRQVPMTYPPDAKAKDVEGFVTLSLLIGKDGSIQKVKVLDSKPDGVFDDVAAQGIRQWRFEPATYRGEPVKVWARQKIRFDLS